MPEIPLAGLLAARAGFAAMDPRPQRPSYIDYGQVKAWQIDTWRLGMSM